MSYPSCDCQIKKIKTLVSPEGAIRSEWEKVRDLRAKEKYKSKSDVITKDHKITETEKVLK